MSVLVQDLRYAFRTLAKQPGFTAVIVLTLALGIGANTAVFSFVYGMLLKPLGYPQEEQLFALFTANPTQGWSRANVSIADYRDWREQSTCFADMGICSHSSYNLAGGDRPEHVRAVKASASLLPVFGFEARIGRAFGPEEDQPGKDHVVVLSDSFWRRRFGAAPDVVGKTVMLDGTPFTILGVLPAEVERAWRPFDVWRPFANYDNGGGRGYRAYSVFARLKPGVSVAEARTELAGITARLAESHPRTNKGCTANVVPIIDKVVDKTARTAVAAVLAAAVFVLLIACVNVANLMLARGSVRQQEFAVRSSLGASGWRLTRQTITECTILSLIGGTVGLLLALWAVESLIAIMPDNAPRKNDFGVDQPVLLFTVLLSLFTALLFGLVPAVKAARVNLSEALKDAARSASPGKTRRFGRQGLVAGQIALALALVVCAGLMIQSAHRLMSADLGFEARQLLTMCVRLPTRTYEDDAARISFFEQVTRRMRAIPGVQAAAAALILPFDRSNSFSDVTADSGMSADPAGQTIAGVTTVTPEFFQTMGIPLLAGRDFNEQDTFDSQPVVIVSEPLARRFWPGGAIGKRLKYGSPDSDNPWFTVVGVVGNVMRRSGLDRSAAVPYTYVPYAQSPSSYMTLVARTLSDPRTATKAAHSAIWEIDPDQAIYKVQSMEDMVFSEIGVWSIVAGLVSVFAFIALVLAAVGLYGVMSYAVTQRTREIGIRIALGARSLDVLSMVIRRSALLTLLGVVGGIGLALALGQMLESLMYGVSPADPLTFAAVSVMMIVVSILASYIPARRATRVDPVVALRCE